MVISPGGGLTFYLTPELILVVYKVLRIQDGSDGAKIDVVEIGLQRQALKRAPPFAGCNDSTISPFIGRFWLQISITAQMRGNCWFGIGFRGSDTLGSSHRYPTE